MEQETEMELQKQLPHAGTLTPVAFAINPDLTRDDWVRAGEILHQSNATLSWWLGDWFNYGVAKFCHGDHGGMKGIIEAPDWRGPAYQTCKKYGWVARVFPRVRRRTLVPFSLHIEVANHRIDAQQQDQLLDRAEIERASVLQVREWVREAIEAQPQLVPSREQLVAHFKDVPMSKSSRDRLRRVIDRDPSIAARVMSGEITAGRADALAKAAYESRRVRFIGHTRDKAVQAAQANATVSVLGDDTTYMAKQLHRAVRILAELDTKHIGLHTLRRALDAQERRFMDDQLRPALRCLRRVEESFAAKAGDIVSNDDNHEATA